WNMPADGNNRIMAYQSNYDGSGNLTYVTGLSGSSTFNSENQLASFSGNIVASFAYDGDGRRVRTSETWVNPQTTWYWNDLSGDVLVETDQLLNIRNLYFYLNGERIGYAPQGGAGNIVYFYYRAQLGNVRAITDQNGNQCFAADYDPWGGIIGNPPDNCPTEYNRFTGKDRDAIMGVDYCGARYYKNDMGRFYSPDDPLGDQDADDPQSWNLYTYVRNNPLRNIDRDGRDCEQAADGTVKCPVTVPEEKPATQPIITTADLNPINDRAPLAFQGFVNLFLNGQLKRGGTQLLLGLGGAVMLNAFSLAKGGDEIIVTGQGLQHVLDGHSVAGAANAGKSVFSPGEDITKLI